jgi:diguanylate cyclase (GGDEF)-like protein
MPAFLTGLLGRASATGAAIASIMVAALVVSGFSYVATRDAFSRYQQVNDSVRASGDIVFDVILQENAVLDYLSTRDPLFLQRFTYATGKTNDDIDRFNLETDVLASPSVDAAIARLRALNNEWTMTSTAQLHPGLPQVQARRLHARETQLTDDMREDVGLVTQVAQDKRAKVVMDAGWTIIAGAVVLMGLIALLGTIGMVTERSRRYQQHLAAIAREKELERVSELAFHDQLTGLQNRPSFMLSFEQILDRVQRSTQGAACLFVDLDGFKAVNDTLGHQAGDRVLQNVAKTLREAIRKSDIVGRLGGDEFVIVLPMIAQRSDATTVAEKILRVVEKPMDVDAEAPARVSASIGISFSPDDGREAETLLKLADSAMYVAKKGGKNRFAVYEKAASAADGAAVSGAIIPASG